MAQLITSLHSFSAISPTKTPSYQLKSLDNLAIQDNIVSQSKNSLHKIISASPNVKSKRLQRLRCSASVRNGGKQGNVIEVEDGEAMEKFIQDAGEKMVVVNVSTTTCGPCKLIFPKVAKMSMEYPDTLFYKINGDKSTSTRALMKKWGVRAVPNFRFYKRGELLHSHSGSKEDELRAYFLTHYTVHESVTS